MSHRDILETNNCKVVYTYTKVFQKHVKYEKLKLLITNCLFCKRVISKFLAIN